jgi:hypothetical protein
LRARIRIHRQNHPDAAADRTGTKLAVVGPVANDVITANARNVVWLGRWQLRGTATQNLSGTFQQYAQCAFASNSGRCEKALAIIGRADQAVNRDHFTEKSKRRATRVAARRSTNPFEGPAKTNST